METKASWAAGSSRAKFVLREGPGGGVHLQGAPGRARPLVSTRHPSRHRTHRGAGGRRHQTFPHPTSRTSRNTAARKFLSWGTAGALANPYRDRGQCSCQPGEASRIPSETSGCSQGASPRAPVRGQDGRHGAGRCHPPLQQRRSEAWHIHLTSVGRSRVVP